MHTVLITFLRAESEDALRVRVKRRTVSEFSFSGVYYKVATDGHKVGGSKLDSQYLKSIVY